MPPKCLRPCHPWVVGCWACSLTWPTTSGGGCLRSCQPVSLCRSVLCRLRPPYAANWNISVPLCGKRLVGRVANNIWRCMSQTLAEASFCCVLHSANCRSNARLLPLIPFGRFTVPRQQITNSLTLHGPHVNVFVPQVQDTRKRNRHMFTT